MEKRYKKYFKESESIIYNVKIAFTGKLENRSRNPFSDAGSSLSFTLDNVSYDELNSKLGKCRKIRLGSDDDKVDFQWFLLGENNLRIIIWNYKDGPNYKGISDEETDEYYDTVSSITSWSVWSNQPKIAEAILESLF